jgi:hypothetical protein
MAYSPLCFAEIGSLVLIIVRKSSKLHEMSLHIENETAEAHFVMKLLDQLQEVMR